MSTEKDIVIIGSGPGGYVAAIRASQLGKSVALVEDKHLGGICLNYGCIPTKALIKSAELLEHARDAKSFGVNCGDITFDFDAIVKRSRDVADRMSKGVEFLMKKNKIEVVIGRGTLVSANEVEVKGKDNRKIKAKNVIIATGGRPRAIPEAPFNGTTIITSKEAMTLKKLPKSIAIIGGGAIGVEFAYVFNTLGVDVTQIEMLDHLLPASDEDASKALERVFKKKGVKLKLGYKVAKVEDRKTSVKVTIEGKKKEEIEADLALVAIGVQANVENLGLEKLGVELHRGFIKVDECLRTNVKGVYAIGDVAGRQLLAHKASQEGIKAAHHICGVESDPINYDAIPACTYSNPQVATVGASEADARKKSKEVLVGKFPFSASGMAVAAGDTEGFVKVVADGKYGEVLGASIVGPEATELIAEFVTAMRSELTLHEIDGTVHAHPTLSEASMEASAAALSKVIHI
ncbi:MAG: dihydrolipoyl dehydrogenase [Planctomycetes bacterium]|nr:dihydrolipoyl dehydrogenase [Planctomycetota bacterium]